MLKVTQELMAKFTKVKKVKQQIISYLHTVKISFSTKKFVNFKQDQILTAMKFSSNYIFDLIIICSRVFLSVLMQGSSLFEKKSYATQECMDEISSELNDLTKGAYIPSADRKFQNPLYQTIVK